ncbi:MAG: hypothetical protein AAFV88_12840 [Planctomycetota bacterium]
MLRAIGLLLIGLFPLAMTGCVGPMGAGCCGPIASSCGSCNSGCETGSCGGCDSCSGCGELYIDPWINHPADCVDPCDQCGNFNGQSCGKCRSVFAGAKSLWGYRCGCEAAPTPLSDRCFAPRCSSSCGGCDECVSEPACGCEGACDCGFEPSCGLEPGCGMEVSCGCEGGCSCGGGEYYPEVIHTAPTVIEGHAMDSVEPAYKPSRTRQIFRPRTATNHGFLNEHRR